MHMIW